MPDKSSSAVFDVGLARPGLRIIRPTQPSAERDGTADCVANLGSQMPYRSNSAAPDVDLAWFDLRIIRGMQSSAGPRHDG